MYSWWWVWKAPETCRVKLQWNKIYCAQLHLVWLLYYRIAMNRTINLKKNSIRLEFSSAALWRQIWYMTNPPQEGSGHYFPVVPCRTLRSSWLKLSDIHCSLCAILPLLFRPRLQTIDIQLLKSSDYFINIQQFCFLPTAAFLCFICFSEQTAAISWYSINRLVFITDTECAYYAVRNESLNTAKVNFSIISNYNYVDNIWSWMYSYVLLMMGGGTAWNM